MKEHDWAELKEHYQREGHILLDGVLDAATLHMLRAEAALARNEVDVRLAAAGLTSHRGTNLGQNYSIPGHHVRRPALATFIIGDVMRAVCRATIGDEAWLFTDQFLMKGPGSEMDFNWHQDGAYVPVAHNPFVVVWITLVEVTVENGTIFAVPFSAMDQPKLLAHEMHPTNADLVAAHPYGDGAPLTCGAGSILAFDSRFLHCSYNNTSPDEWRNIYQVRYTPHPVLDPDTGKPLNFAKRVF